MSTDLGLGVASRKEEHELLYGMLKGAYTGLIDFEFKHAGFMAVVIGWIVTSQHAQLVIASSLPVRVIGTVVVVALTALHGLWCKRWHERSQLSFTKLEELNYMPLTYYESHKMGTYLPLSFASIHALLAFVVLILFWSMQTILDVISANG